MARAQEQKVQIAARCKEMIDYASELADDLMSILVEMESETARTVQQWSAVKESMRFYNGQLQEQAAQMQDDIDALLNQQRLVNADHQAAIKEMGDQCAELQQNAVTGTDENLQERCLDLMAENGRLVCEKFQTRQEAQRTQSRANLLSAAAMRAMMRGKALQQQQRAIDSWRGCCAAGSRFLARHSRLIITKMRRSCFVWWLVATREKARLGRRAIRSISR